MLGVLINSHAEQLDSSTWIKSVFHLPTDRNIRHDAHLSTSFPHARILKRHQSKQEPTNSRRVVPDR